MAVRVREIAEVVQPLRKAEAQFNGGGRGASSGRSGPGAKASAEPTPPTQWPQPTADGETPFRNSRGWLPLRALVGTDTMVKSPQRHSGSSNCQRGTRLLRANAMRFRFSRTGEVIATLMAGATYAISIHLIDMRPSDSWITQADEVVVAFLAVASFAEGLALSIESIRTRGQTKVWGIGRWFWTLSGLSMVLAGARFIVERPWLKWGLEGEILRLIVRLSFNGASEAIHRLSLYFLVFFLVSWLAQYPRDSAPDFREWTGRVFGGLVILWEATVAMASVI